MINFLFQPKRGGEKSRLWSARIRLEDWLKPRTFRLRVTDKRVAQQKLQQIIEEFEREAAGIIAPKAQRSAAQTPLLIHLENFFTDCEAAGKAVNTLKKYRSNLPLLLNRCGWVHLRDVTEESFCSWRARSGLSPKTANDLLGSMRTFLNWMRRRKLIIANPLEHAQKVTNLAPGGFRRALSVDEIHRFLQNAPAARATVYQLILYTGLRREEVNGLRWSNFDLMADPARLRVPASLAKNRKESTHFLRIELVQTLERFRPLTSKPDDFAFRGHVPKVRTLKRDLAAAGIPFEDDRGRRIDLHALRTTFGTLLSTSGVSPRAAMELMRHSDMKLTMKVYTDASQLPLAAETARLPSFSLSEKPSEKSAQLSAQRSAQTGVFPGLEPSPVGLFIKEWGHAAEKQQTCPLQ